MTVDRGSSPPRPRSDPDPDPADRFLRNWLLWVSIGESVGFLAPALTQLALGSSSIVAPALILAGAVEGTVLGWTQATVLRSRVPALCRRRWVRATAIGAAAAWFIGLVPAEWADVWRRWPEPTQLGAGLVTALLLISALGVAQWFELRRHLRGAWGWILGSAAAWCAGLGVFFAVATPLWHEGQSGALVLLIGVLAGLLMAVTMSLVSGLVLLRLMRQTESPSQHA